MKYHAISSREKSESGIYHVVFRGNNRQRIFEDDEDYQKYLQILNGCREECGFHLYAWCLMPNHIHLLIKEGREPLEIVFRKTGSRFVYWYNTKYKRVGHLFQDRYRSETVEDESYFLTVIRYIHLNPVKAGLCDMADKWPYSSYRRYFDPNAGSGTDLLFNLIERKEFEIFHQEKNNDICLDFDHSPVRIITDEQSEMIALRAAGCEEVSMIQDLPEDQRTAVIRILLRSGASFRQINRLTGTSIGIIQRIRKEM